MAVAFFVASLAGPRLIGRYGGPVTVAGALIQGTGLVLLVLAVRRDWPDLGFVDLLPSLLPAGLGRICGCPGWSAES